MYRMNASSIMQSSDLLPKEACGWQSFFDLKTMKQAFNRVYMTSIANEEILIEKESAFAGAKLIQ